MKEGILIRDLVKRDKVLPADEIDDVLDLRKMTEIGVPGGKLGAAAADDRHAALPLRPSGR